MPCQIAKGPNAQRPRLTCTECYRRKIKCDKNIPCASCSKRGSAIICTREDFSSASAPPAYQSRGNIDIPSDLVQALLDRVNQLEARLEEQDPISITRSPRNSSTSPEQSTPPVGNEVPVSPCEPSTPERNTNHEDAATVLEFLTWGRTKDADFSKAPEYTRGPSRVNAGFEEESSTSNVLHESGKNAQLDILEALLPSKSHIKQLSNYHDASILWYHGSYLATTFKRDLDVFLTNYGGDVRHPELNLQWLALLFAVLTGSITCAPLSVLRIWQFSEAERSVLSVEWYEATVTCLNISRYAEMHTIHSVQAIATLTIAAHILGMSNSQSVLLASAGRIAQSLGLHRLGAETATAPIEQIRKREAGRRVFGQLCTQDWFQIPFSESYSLNPRFLNTTKPLNCNEDDMVVQPQFVPTAASYCNYRYEIAALMPQLLDATANCNTLFTKYEQVLQYDDKMRKLATAYMPAFLSTNAPVAENWPIYVGWARRSLAICAAHKIIMIHRKFLGLSFTNSTFSFTRRTCIAASKTILKEALSAIDENGPVLWIEQAFSIAAGIILCLDSFHRKAGDTEYEEHTRLVADAIEYLKKFSNSRIAARGVNLLTALLQELCRDPNIRQSRKRLRTEDESESSSSRQRKRTFSVEDFIKNVSRNFESARINTNPGGDLHLSTVEPDWSNFADLLPTQTGFVGHNLFDDLLAFQF